MRGRALGTGSTPELRRAGRVLRDAEPLRVQVAERAARERDVALARLLEEARGTRVIAPDGGVEAEERAGRAAADRIAEVAAAQRIRQRLFCVVRGRGRTLGVFDAHDAATATITERAR